MFSSPPSLPQTMASQRRFELLEAYANTTAEEAVESRARVQELQERYGM